MKFSIIIPAYNAAKIIELCIDSVCNQSFTDWELIIVDDATPGGFETMYEPRISLLTHEHNLGPGPARNTGIAAAKGEWLVFLDADDEFAPGALWKLSDFIDVQSDGLDLVRLGRPGMRSEAKLLNGSREELLWHYVSLRMDGSVCGTAVRRSTL